MKISGIEFFDDLIEIHNEQNSIIDKYPKMRSLLERACKDLTKNENIQFSNLFSRLNYVCEKTKLDRRKTFQINTFRINANNVLHSEFKPGQEDYFQNLKALCNVISHFYAIAIPTVLSLILPETDYYKPTRRQGEPIKRMRIEVSSSDEQYIYAFDEDNPTDEPIKIKHHVNGINDAFNSTITKLWKGVQLNLIDVTLDDQGIYTPDLIILEPDYLLDISSLAECMKEYGKNPLNFIQSKFEPIKNNRHILLGNIANLFLDEFVNEKPDLPVVYSDSIKKAFKAAPFEFSTCTDIDANFFQDTQLQFQNIRNVVNNVFPSKEIDREHAVLEPAFICEHLGVQGRLDFLQLTSQHGKKFVIELKSGKAPFPESNFELVGLNHMSQAFIYQFMIQKVLDVKFEDLRTFIFYSKYSDPSAGLRLPKPYMAAIKEIMNLRNLIVATEKNIASDLTALQAREIVNSITPKTLITNGYNNQNFIERYIVPQIAHFKSFFENATTLELEYFHSFYAFVTREHYISKVGDGEDEKNRGISSLWLSSLKDKFEAGEILTDLTITENLSETDLLVIKLNIPKYDGDFLPNFRHGDIVVLYERNSSRDQVTNKQIFKGVIQELTSTEIAIRFRHKQRNKSVFNHNGKYAVEHDFIDLSYSAMYRGLYAFLQANQDRKDLLLHQRSPTQNLSVKLSKQYISREVDDIVLKAKQANDYFLLVGPPGTGKTSNALKSMVEEFYSEPDHDILLLSYTNRAVDEICDVLDNIEPTIPYIRIGSELSCDEKHRKRLLEKVIAHCEKRDDVKNKIQSHRVFVGTVASISGKTELFKLKQFQVAIIDEASQILEPSLVGILSAKNQKGGNAIQKFILIGDYKQLPAVVLQKEEDSEVNNERLSKINLKNRRNSLFERLYHFHKERNESHIWGMLHQQWRMHPDIALFPNYSFYNSKLINGNATHQSEILDFKEFDKQNPFHWLLASKRLVFIPSEKHTADKNHKTNTYEAQIVKELVKQIFSFYNLQNLAFSADKTIGIITPYRSQIALIKKEIRTLQIPVLNDICVDTVERFQGSQRDIIIYSFSVNTFSQVDFLANNIVDEEQIIDRKLNVAITRARKQLFVIGNPSILSNNLNYYRLIEFIRSKAGYINVRPKDFIDGNFALDTPDTDIEIGNKIYQPEERFVSAFNRLVIQPLQSDKNTQYPNILLGHDHDYNRLNVIQYGRANFDQATIEHSSMDKVNLYCFYNMRKHYFTSMAIFDSFSDYLKLAFTNTANRIVLIDFGCGPLTSGLAFNQSFSAEPNFHFDYVGIDVSNAMLYKSKEFSQSGLFNKDTRFMFVQSLVDVPASYWDSVLTLSNTVILNFSYLFGNLSKEDTENLAVRINTFLDNYPLNKFILIFQNSAMEKRNRMYINFKKAVPRLCSVIEPRIETVTYKNAIMSSFDKSETVYYEILSN